MKIDLEKMNSIKDEIIDINSNMQRIFNNVKGNFEGISRNINTYELKTDINNIQNNVTSLSTNLTNDLNSLENFMADQIETYINIEEEAKQALENLITKINSVVNEDGNFLDKNGDVIQIATIAPPTYSGRQTNEGSVLYNADNPYKAVDTSRLNKPAAQGPQSNHLTKSGGVATSPNGEKETWYDLNMNGVVNIMRTQCNCTEPEFTYWVREDGVKMLGKYVMVAADLDNYPRGTFVETSLGTGIVCDTGYLGPNHFDIAVDWKTNNYS